MPAESVLVFRTGNLGDTICAIPAFRVIREHYSKAHLVLVCDRPDHGEKIAAASVIADLNIFDRIEAYSSKKGWSTVLELRRLIRDVYPKTIVILPQVREPDVSLRRKKWLFRACGVADIRGCQIRGSDHEWHVNETERLLQVLRRAGISGNHPGYDIPINQESASSIAGKLKDLGVRNSDRLIIFCGGGKASSQRWPMERYGKVLATLANSISGVIVGVGTASEVNEYRAELVPSFPSLRLLDQPLSLSELIELLRRAQMYIGNDTGPMHVAAAVGCPVAVIMSARNAPGMWDPDVTQKLIIRNRTECENCFLVDCVTEKHRCMQEIAVEQVTRELIPFVKSLPSSEAHA